MFIKCMLTFRPQSNNILAIIRLHTTCIQYNNKTIGNICSLYACKQIDHKKQHSEWVSDVTKVHVCKMCANYCYLNVHILLINYTNVCIHMHAVYKLVSKFLYGKSLQYFSPPHNCAIRYPEQHM